MKEKDRRLLAEIHRGANLIFENAEQLYEEAQTLGVRRAFCRAVCLHQISIEECSKIDVLGAAATGLLIGHSVDLAKLAKSMRRHEVKNFNFAYMSVTTPDEREAQDRGDHKTASRIFRGQQRAIHDSLNTNKNASLYVDFADGKLVAPSERITEELAVHMQALNGQQLAVSEGFLKLLSRMVAEPDEAAALARSSVESLQAAPADQVRNALNGWLEEAKSRFRK